MLDIEIRIICGVCLETDCWTSWSLRLFCCIWVLLYEFSVARCYSFVLIFHGSFTSNCAQAVTINHVTINPRWRKALRVRVFTAFVSHTHACFKRFSVSIWQFTVCRIYCCHVLINRCVFWEKSGGMVFGILIVTDGLVDRNGLALLIVTD